MKRKLLSLALGVLALCPPAGACTLWGATGDGITQGGATMVVKVRDFRPSTQTVKHVCDGDGFAFYGLFIGTRQFFNNGVNERGLYVGNSTASSVPKKERTRVPLWRESAQCNLMESLMRRCASVDEAIEKLQSIQNGHPINFILADSDSVAIVEFLPNAKMTVRKTSRGKLAHTNHFIEPESEPFNVKIGESSLARYERINELLASTKKPYSFEDFVAMSHDRNEGPDRSIFRTGSTPELGRTLAVTAVCLEKGQKPLIRIRYQKNPHDMDDPWETVQFEFPDSKSQK